MNTKTPRFLLVDDDVLMRNMYSMKFKGAGFDFFELPNADGDFLDKVIEIKPDVILMDIHFDKCQNNGVDAGGALQRDERTKHIPIIFFTNADIEELAQRAQKLASCIGLIIKAENIPSEVLKKVLEMYQSHSFKVH